jgi:hypothetical protein
MRFDLHTHSHHSDGLLSVDELVALAAAERVEILALTDHDCVAGTAAALTQCRARGIEGVAGVELSVQWRGQSIHVLGLGIDPQTPELTLHLSDLIARRRARLRAMAAKLRRKANALLAAQVETVAAEAAVPTRMHVARALVASGVCADTASAFRQWLMRGRAGYAPADWPDLTSTLRVIRSAGGRAALAHPQRYALSSGGLRALIGEFAAAGGAALEASSGSTSPNDVARLAALATAANLTVSAGSDFHDPANTWNRLGRFAKLPAGCALLSQRLISNG